MIYICLLLRCYLCTNPQETVYKITKTFWDNLDQVTSDAAWAKQLDVNFAVTNIGGMTIHPGAARYYREIGVLN